MQLISNYAYATRSSLLWALVYTPIDPLASSHTLFQLFYTNSDSLFLL